MRCLINETYMYLLQHPDVSINASRIGDAIGRNRKTVARQLQELKEDGLLDDNGVIINAYDISIFYPQVDKYSQALLILQDCGIRIESLEQASRLLKVSSKTLKPYYDELKATSNDDKLYDGPAVYQITPYDDENNIIYIGYTTNFANRKKEHISYITNMSIKAKLYKYCVDNNITRVKITTIIEHQDLQMLKALESYLISVLRPVGNATVM